MKYGPAVSSVFTSETSAAVLAMTVTLSGAVVTPSALAVAVLVTNPAATSPGVTRYVAVQVTDSPGSRKLSRSPAVVTAGQVTVALSSETATGPSSDAKPLLVTR